MRGHLFGSVAGEIGAPAGGAEHYHHFADAYTPTLHPTCRREAELEAERQEKLREERERQEARRAEEEERLR